jgi:hypothetical protein
MTYKITDLFSSLGHLALTSALATLVFWPLHLTGVSNASVIAVLFPMGLYYGREIIDQNRNIREAYELSGMTSQQARTASAHPKHLFGVGWDLDGILDVVVPWIGGVALAVAGYFVP